MDFLYFFVLFGLLVLLPLWLLLRFGDSLDRWFAKLWTSGEGRPEQTGLRRRARLARDDATWADGGGGGSWGGGGFGGGDGGGG